MHNDIYEYDRMGVTDIRMTCEDKTKYTVNNPNSAPKYAGCFINIFQIINSKLKLNYNLKQSFN